MAETVNYKSIVVLISGNGSNLQAIIEQIIERKIPANITAVFSNRIDAYGLERAKLSSIPAIFIDHKAFDCRDSYDAQMRQEIDKYSPDLIVLAGFMRILSADFVEHYQGRMLNIHPSLLPKYKGLQTHQRAIDEGDTEHGASVHFVTPDLDGGPVVLQSKVPIFPDQTTNELSQRVQEQERQMYPLVIKWFCQNRLAMKNNRAYLDDKILPDSGYAVD